MKTVTVTAGTFIPYLLWRYSDVREREAEIHAKRLKDQEAERMAYHRRKIRLERFEQQTEEVDAISDARAMWTLKKLIVTGKLF